MILHKRAIDESDDIMMRPSRFITDLPKDLVEVWNVKSGW
jgi:hypothetical protein